MAGKQGFASMDAEIVLIRHPYIPNLTPEQIEESKAAYNRLLDLIIQACMIPVRPIGNLKTLPTLDPK